MDPIFTFQIIILRVAFFQVNDKYWQIYYSPQGDWTLFTPLRQAKSAEETRNSRQTPELLEKSITKLYASTV